VDFLFVLKPSSPAVTDEVVVVEIKRARTVHGVVRKATLEEVNKFHTYVVAVREYYNRNTSPPAVRGLMICEAYTAQADPIRRNLEQLRDPRLEFKTWSRVVEDTEKLHLGWLKATRRRGADP
jgi:RecB family endonuclease NucS